MADNLGNAPPGKILIVLLGAIGDVVRALPLAVRIKDAWPGTILHWAIEPRSADIVIGHSCIDDIIIFNRPGGLKAYFLFLKRIRGERYDLVLDLQRHLKSGITSFCTNASRRIGFHRRNAKEFNWLFNNETIPPVENFSLKIKHYQLFGDMLQIPKTDPLKFGLVESSEDASYVEKFIEEALSANGITRDRVKGFVGVILGSSWPSRFWQKEHYIKTIEDLYGELGLVSVLVGAKGETQLALELASSLKKEFFINIVGRTSLRQLFSVFKRVQLAFGPDSGPMHIAAAAGVPVVSLWGSTSPSRSAPYGSEQHVLRSSVGCSPCYRRECPGLSNLCLFEISSDAVIDKARLITQLGR